MSAELSVVVCTFNRSRNLPGCVEALARQAGAEGIDWELVVVDNNSSDDTAAVVRELGARHPFPIRYLFEGEQGLSHARNRGIAGTMSRYLAFIDDDIRPEPEWLRAVHEAFVETGADAVGGRIHVESPKPLPAWIDEEMRGFLGHRDFGDEPFLMDGVRQFPFGGNMAARRALVERVGGFDPRMGRKGEGRKADELFKGEETDFFHRVAEAGGRIAYEPRAIVRHLILAHQLEKRFFRTLHFTAGYQKALLDARSYPRTLLGVPLFLFRQTAGSAARYLGQLLSRGPSRAFRQQMTVGYFLGMMLGYHRRERGRRADGGLARGC